MRIAVPAETAPGETRVALVTRSVTQLQSAGATIAVEAGAGEEAGITDAAYREAGAEIASDRSALLRDSDVTVVVRRPANEDLRRLKEGSILVGLIDPGGDPGPVRLLDERRITAFRMEALPRISRAQDMDVLSSMATIAGYHASVMAAYRLPRLFPLLMTAAGTITPAHGLVLGAGVAGLQAIATCKRLGAVVESYDVRPVVKEQVESLGARFIDVGVESAEQQDAGGYAKELTEEAHRREQEVLTKHVHDADVVITTAFVPGKRAPILLTKAMVDGMRHGSVIVDLAASAGGNCEYTKPDEEVRHDGVLILGPTNLPAAIPGQASQLFSHNVTRFMLQFIKERAISLDFDDEVIAKTCMTHDGKPMGEQITALVGGAA
ncbi:MAG: Re/Si-specific NAD(P)(+) transhydrogenase subunit alpha [Candidatus Dormibacteraeota bacterium]|nr:Re/Si-specific NAD(P)(+) transhydrogenase subunit alpha [Candidatus Dormibacteraeota bacterium]